MKELIADILGLVRVFHYTKEETDTSETITNKISTAITNLSNSIDSKLNLKSNINHKHTKTDISDLKNASSTNAGLLSSDDKNKLDGIEAQANKVTVDFDFSSESTNPVANRVIKNGMYTKDEIHELMAHIDVGHGKLLSINVTEDGILQVDNDSFEYYTTDEVDAELAKKTVTFEQQANPDSGDFATYVLKQNNVQVGPKIKIPQDFLIRSGSVKTCTVANNPVQGYKVGDKYLDLVINTKEGSSTNNHIYILATDFIDDYYADNITLQLVNRVFSIKDKGVSKSKLSDEVQISLDYADTFNNSPCKDITDDNIINWNNKAEISDIPTKVSELTNDRGYLTVHQDISMKVDKVSGKGLSTEDFTSAEKTKLAGIEAGANKTTIDSSMSTSSTNPVQNKVINTALGNKVDKVSGKGLSTEDFTSAEKTKLAGIETGANKTTIDSSMSASSTNPVQNKVIKDYIDDSVGDIISGDIDLSSTHNHDDRYFTESEINTKLNTLANSKSKVSVTPAKTSGTEIATITIDGTPTKLYQQDENTTYSNATTSKDGLMSSSDKTKLDGIATGANKTVLNNTVNSTSTTEAATANAVKTAYDKANHSHPYSSSSHNHTTHNTQTIASGSDLNTITTAGWYNNNSNSDVQKMSNTPWQATAPSSGGVGQAFAMEVLYTYGCIQILYPYNSNDIWVRRNNSNALGANNWTGWTKVYNSSNLTKADITSLGIPGTDTNTTYSADNSSLQVLSNQFSVKSGGITSSHIKDGNVTNAKLNDLSNLVTEYIVGTHGTTATPTWTGKSTKINSLQAGQVIFFKMTSAGTSAGNTLNLTLADGTTTTGAKNIYYNAGARLTTHFPQNTILCMVYDGSSWICTAIQNTNTYDRISTYGQVVNGESSQIVANTLICGKSDKKYYKLANGVVFDIRYPIVLLAGALNSGANTYNVYGVKPDVNLQTTVSGKTVTNLQEVYVEGTAFSNGQFTVSSNVFVSDGSLTSGRYYIPIGQAYSTTNIRFVTSNKVFYYNGTNLIPVEDVKYNNYTHPNSGVTAGTNYNGNQTPSFGGTFNIPKLTFNAQGHITASANSTVTVPSLPTASTLTAGILKIGTTANDACAGNDSRLSNARTPTSHAHGNISNEGVISGATSKNVVTDANGKITTENKPTIPTGSSTATDIKMNGTQNAGSSSNFAKADHVHPTDTSRAASSHAHGNISNNGAIGSTANLPIITGSNGVLQASSFGTGANTFCQGNDSRLSNARTPIFNSVGASSSSTKDLNNFTTGGFYYCDNDGNAAYVSNQPRTSGQKAFFLLVETWGASSPNYTKQTLTYYDTNQTYTRTKAGSSTGWKAWVELSKDTNTTYTAESTATNIKMNGTQSVGSLATYARGDHVHPSDISKISTSAIKNDLTTGGATNVLSAEQGKNLQNNKVDKAQGSGNANKTLSTDANGNVIVEAKNNHTHDYLPTNANGTTTGTLTATKFINSSSNNTNILLGNGNTIAQSTFATSGHSHARTLVKSYGDSGTAKEVLLYAIPSIRMCFVYFRDVFSSLSANTNHVVANEGWIPEEYCPIRPAYGGGNYNSGFFALQSGSLTFRAGVNISQKEVYASVYWLY